MSRHASREASRIGHKTDHDKGARQNLPRSSGNVSHRKDSSGNAPKNISLDNVECWRCHKKGHYSSSCLNTQRVFAAQIIEEDGETEPQIPSDKPSDDAENHVKQEDPIEDQPDDPNGSHYNSTQEGFPLDEYEEYVEMLDDHESNDEDVVYICAGRIKENIENDDSTIDTPAIRAIDETEETTRVYCYRMTQPVGTITCPKCVNGEDICLAAYVSINGIRAYMLFDSGSTTDAVSPDLARVAELSLLALDKPVTL